MKTQSTKLSEFENKVEQRCASQSACLVQDLFIEQAVRFPDHPAVISDNRTLSYGELLVSSRAWGKKLRELGAQPNNLVAVVMEKGWEQIVAAYGILESGAAYLPIDPSIPKDRLWYLLADGGVKIVLTQSSVDAKLQWPDGVVRFCVDSENPEAESLAALTHLQGPDDIAYVLYTSGSTGKPKGVMIAHRGLVNCIVDTNRHFNITAEDRALAVTALHHDMSVYDIFGLLAVGGAIVMPSPAEAKAPDHWLNLIRKERVTIWNSVPGFMEMLLEHVAGQNLQVSGQLRLAFLGGDWIPLSAPDRIHRHFGDVDVVSVGGPTETTVWNIWYPVKEVDPGWRSIPYGHAIANTKYYVLDESLRECAEGQPGELCCAGVGLMKGYWRDEEKTRLRFAIHSRTGEQIFRTGDRGRFLPDGEIEFLGRIDSQIKINGQRIELGEIESYLVSYPGVKQAVVSVIQQGSQKRLAAYLVPDGDRLPSAQELRVYLERHLPHYMVPLHFITLGSLPLNANGKVDRSALPAPDLVAPDNPAAGASVSANDLEDLIMDVWRKVLTIKRVGRDDNFFDLGGDSISLVQAHSELQRYLNRTLPITDLFEFPSVRTLRDHLERQSPQKLVVSEMEQRANKQRAALARQRSRNS
jgi:amino acid adenylation domain-containing protein